MNSLFPWLKILTIIVLSQRFIISDVQAKFIEDFSNLKKFLDKPAKSNFHLGFGVSPLGVIGEKTFFSLSLFQLHYIKERWDLNLFSADFGVISSKNTYAEAKNFTLKTVPKFMIAQIFDNTRLSAGPLLGLEFIKFDNVKTQLRKGSAVTVSDNLSASAPVVGFVVEQTVDFPNYMVKITESFYRQGYSITDANNGWTHFYEDAQAEEPKNQDLMKANDVFVITISVVF